MSPINAISRRQALKGSLMLPLVAGLGAASASPSSARAVAAEPRRGSKVLIAYFTRTGNTRLIATQIARARNAELFQIVPADPYPEDYEAQVAQATEERRRGYEPPLQALAPALSSYDTVFLGFPIWGTTAPSIIRSFLSNHDLSGKTLVPFITHGGYGLGSSLDVVAEHAPGARIIEAFSKACDQERETLAEVTQWLETTGVPR
ncbi:MULTISPECIES: flavodoxin [unclassified Aureimonas]|uniref:flavodoxin n=1 Tax=unclassified Aureimonas TaxID=2615206 RepID=UPI0006FDE902|nr:MULTISPECIES: flavodoxin [unclassified Aureimonas]KQT53094.1 flavodoxin [Aureimonas sp. Leaf427]KQT80553.1 flavodoxin [Aureimonas sp. Leaf460]